MDNNNNNTNKQLSKFDSFITKIKENNLLGNKRKQNDDNDSNNDNMNNNNLDNLQFKEKNYHDKRRVNFVSFSSTDKQHNLSKLYSYYCSICGTCSFVLDLNIDKLPKRRFDNSKIICTDKLFIKNYLNNTDNSNNNIIHVLVDENKYEKRVYLKCNNCKFNIGYSCFVNNNNSSINKDNIIYINTSNIVVDPIQSDIYIKIHMSKTKRNEDIFNKKYTKALK